MGRWTELETESCFNVQAGFELLDSGSPTSAFPVIERAGAVTLEGGDIMLYSS